MSLKAVHIIFIVFSTLLAFALGIYCVWVNRTNETTAYTPGAVCSFAIALMLVIYGCWFWRKMKRLRLI